MKNIVWCFSCVLLFSVVFCVAQQNERQLESNVPCENDANCAEHDIHSICIGNTVESSGVCQCMKDYIPQKNRTHYECLSTPQAYKDTCFKDVQCQVAFSNWAVCVNGQCVCLEGAHFMEGKCYQTIRLGETCSFNQQCLLKNGTTATCQSGKCTCGFREHPVSSPDGESCEISRELGDDCKKDEECINENTRCFGTCRCRPGYTTSGDGRFCLIESERLGDHCEEDPQCESISSNIYCENYYCRCRNHHHPYLNKCYKNVRLNGTCTDDRECWIQPSMNHTLYCKQGICTCAIRYSEDGLTCINAGIKSRESHFILAVGVGVLIWQLMNML